MSLLSIGASCASCHTVDFLPTLCPTCHQIFCSAHITSHQQCSAPGLGFKEANAVAGPSSFRARGICEVGSCGRMSIEGIAGLGGETVQPSAQVEEEDRVSKEIRCAGCGGAFCVEHRAQTSHDCTAPLAHNARHDAFVSRKAQAQAVLARTFPEQAGRVIPKPPPAKDTANIRPKARVEATQSQLKPLQENSPTEAQGGVSMEDRAGVAKTTVRSKTKEEKLWDIHVRKIRSLAVPLRGAPSDVGNQERRYFEWGVGSVDGVKAWEGGGKWSGKVERNWVLASMPLGRLLDLLKTASKIQASTGAMDQAQVCPISSHLPLHICSPFPSKMSLWSDPPTPPPRFQSSFNTAQTGYPTSYGSSSRTANTGRDDDSSV